MLLLLPSICLAAGLAAWNVYSAIQRRILQNDFAMICILSEIRTPNGDRSQVPSLAQVLPAASSLDSSWIFLAGDDKQAPKDVCIRKVKNVACCFSEDGTYTALFGPEEPPNYSLRELVGKSTIKLNIEENIPLHINWEQNIAECIQASSSSASIDLPSSTCTTIEGSYAFCYRDYVNHEEFAGLMQKRWGTEKFWLRPTRTDKLMVSSNNHCQLMASGHLYGFWPLKIIWEGSLCGNTIQWDTTRFVKGWKYFKKTIERPPIAEKLRASPWDVYLPREEQGGGDILILHRRGAGVLVFAREECLSK